MRKQASLLILAGYVAVVASNACSPVKFATVSSEVDGSGHPVDPTCVPTATVGCGEDEVELKQKSVTVKSPTAEVDVLLVIDDSESMKPERQKLGERMRNFTDRLTGLNWRICVTTTSPLSSMQGKLYKFSNNQDVLTSSSPHTNVDVNADGVKNYEDVLLQTLQGIQTTDGNEQGIAATAYTIANTGHSCFRQDAALAVVVISDEDERSTGGWPQYQNSTVISIKQQWSAMQEQNWPEFVFAKFDARFQNDQKPFTFHSLVIRSQKDWVASASKWCEDVQSDYQVFYGTRYEEMSRQTGGIIGNICADDYGSELTGFADRIKTTLQAVTLECQPVGEPVVTTSSSALQPYTVEGNKIVFKNQVPAGVVVTVKYYCKK